MVFSVQDKLNTLSELSRRKLLDILNKISGRKDFIIDTSLMKPLDKIVGASQLKSNGVDKIYKLEARETPLTNTQRVFIINADLVTMKNACDKINSELRQTNDGNSYHIILVGRKTSALQKLLEEEGLFGCVTVYPFQWEFILLDNKTFSLEYTNLFKCLFVNGDQCYLPCIARSIWTMNMILGKPTIKLVQGKFAHIVNNMVEKLHEQLGDPHIQGTEVDCFVIMDRDTDYISTLLTGVTYSSLLDEEFGINTGVVEVKMDKTEKTVNYSLSSSDNVYSQIKNKHFSRVFPFLSAKVKELNKDINKGKHMDVTEMKTFVSHKLPMVTNEKRCLAFHINACEKIIGQMGPTFESIQTAQTDAIQCVNRKGIITCIEELLSMNICNRHVILRLICLLSVTSDGLYTEELAKLKSMFLHVYGYKYLTVFHNLEMAGLCTEVSTVETKNSLSLAKVAHVVSLPTRKSTFAVSAQKLKLLPSELSDYKDPVDPSYVFAGIYIPVICQIIQMLVKKEQRPEEIAKLLSKCTVHYEEKREKINIRTLAVYFIGGVTYAEISALQFLESLIDVQILIFASSVISGNRLMKSFF